MRNKSWLLPLALAACLNCEDEDKCVEICNRVDACGFLPSPLGNSLDNCIGRCEVSPELNDSLQKCIDGNPAEWEDRSAQRTGDINQDRARELRGCPSVAVCLQHITRSSEILGYGLTMLIPEETPVIGTDQKVDRACESGVKLEDAEEICTGWNVARTTTILDDGVTDIRTYFASCVSSLVHQPTWEHVSVGRLRAELVLEGSPEPTDDGGAAGAENQGGNGAAEPSEGGAAGEVAARTGEESEPCFVFSAPLQVNDAGTECVGIVLPFDKDINKAKACERGAACTDSMDNDEDGWTDCDDPKCEEFCDQFSSVAPVTAVGGTASMEPAE